MRGWHGEPYRHSLASKGIKTRWNNKEKRKDIKEVEIELVCCNAEYEGDENARNRCKEYEKLQNEFDNVIIEDVGEYLEIPYFYKTASIFVPKDEVKKWLEILKKRGIEVDILHFDGKEVVN